MKYWLTTIVLFSFSAAADVVTINQKNREFDVVGAADAKKNEVTIKKGDTVRFLNEDDFFHNVFSLSDAKLFDLGSFPKGESRDVVFDEAGTVEVECAIHPEMRIQIHVK